MADPWEDHATAPTRRQPAASNRTKMEPRMLLEALKGINP